jgi:hypothetical protein
MASKDRKVLGLISDGYYVVDECPENPHPDYLGFSDPFRQNVRSVVKSLFELLKPAAAVACCLRPAEQDFCLVAAVTQTPLISIIPEGYTTPSAIVDRIREKSAVCKEVGVNTDEGKAQRDNLIVRSSTHFLFIWNGSIYYPCNVFNQVVGNKPIFWIDLLSSPVTIEVFGYCQEVEELPFKESS